MKTSGSDQASRVSVLGIWNRDSGSIMLALPETFMRNDMKQGPEQPHLAQMHADGRGSWFLERENTAGTEQDAEMP